MRIKAGAPGFRRRIMLDAPSSARIQALRLNHEGGSDSNVIRMALIYFAALVEAKEAGHGIIVRDGELHDDDFAFSPATEATAVSSAGSVKPNLVLHDRTASRLGALRDITGLTSDSELVARRSESILFWWRALVAPEGDPAQYLSAEGARSFCPSLPQESAAEEGVKSVP